MSKLADLKAASSLKEVAPVLGLPASALAFTLYKIPDAAKYKSFTVPKKSGGDRKIDAPCDRLKNLQNHLRTLLVDCRSEIENAGPSKRLISHAFRSEGSIITNAREHLSRRYVLNIDIENFFPSMNFGRVRGFFIKNRSFQLNEAVATVLAQIACHDNALPQGSPCSPIISELIGHVLDMQFIALARKYKCTYSRYVDDVTLSTSRREFPPQIAYQLESGKQQWVLGDDLLYATNRAGFSINHKKTRMQYRGSRQTVTGLTVNDKANIKSDYYRYARAMCNSLFCSGEFTSINSTPDGKGKLPPGNICSLEGVVNHIYFVKRSEMDRTNSLPDFLDKSRRHKDRHGIERLYSRLLSFKNFVANEKPLIITEGKTDNSYLRAALRRLPAYSGVLYELNAGKFSSGLSFLRHSRLTRELLGIDGGGELVSEVYQ